MLLTAGLFGFVTMPLHDLLHLAGLNLIIRVYHHQVIALLHPIQIGGEMVAAGRNPAQATQPGAKTGTKKCHTNDGAGVQLHAPGVGTGQQKARQQAYRHAAQRTHKAGMHDIGFFPGRGGVHMGPGHCRAVIPHHMQAIFADARLAQIRGNPLNGGQ